jgi:hypothetical protein
MSLPDPNNSILAIPQAMANLPPTPEPASLSGMVDLLARAGWANFLVYRVHHVFHRRDASRASQFESYHLSTHQPDARRFQISLGKKLDFGLPVIGE